MTNNLNTNINYNTLINYNYNITIIPIINEQCHCWRVLRSSTQDGSHWRYFYKKYLDTGVGKTNLLGRF